MGRANWDRLYARFPEYKGGLSEEQLRDKLESPEVVMRLVVDIYDSVKREKEREAGQVKMGRRPKPEFVPLEQMLAEIAPPQYTDEPFGQALDKLLKGRSQRQFAAKVPCAQASLSRFIAGKNVPDRPMMEAIAEAAGVPPYYFAEWRAIYLGELVRMVYGVDPRRSIGMMKAILNRIENGRRNGQLTKAVGPW